MTRMTLKDAIGIAIEHDINLKVVPINEFLFGLNVEKEHTNITHHDPEVIVSIVIAHLEEYPDYYKRLKRMERTADKYWKKIGKPSIYK
jgi:hypothetical protein